MSATDELRRLLDERGVEWETDRSGFRVMWGKPLDEFHDTMQFKAVNNALPNGGLNVHICGFTPEQAIAATLGTGTCNRVREYFGRSGKSYREVCSECHHIIYDGWQDKPRYCPFCGRKVVDA